MSGRYWRLATGNGVPSLREEGGVTEAEEKPRFLSTAFTAGGSASDVPFAIGDSLPQVLGVGRDRIPKL